VVLELDERKSTHGFRESACVFEGERTLGMEIIVSTFLKGLKHQDPGKTCSIPTSFANCLQYPRG